MAIILFDDNAHLTLRPLTYTRPVGDLRIGILTIAQKWAKSLKHGYSFHTQAYLQGKFPIKLEERNLFINGSVCPDEALIDAIANLHGNEALLKDGLFIAVKLNETDAKEFNPAVTSNYKPVNYDGNFVALRYPEDIFRNNDTELKKDFILQTKGRTSAKISSTNTLIGDDIFIEDDAQAECSTFNTKNGPIYIGNNSEVWEGTNIRGSFALCNNSQVKMGTKIYGGTTVGPYCRVGGEINNAILWGYSAKGHEGYLGNSVLGEWCNIGADSNNSNLKNNYAEVKLWDYGTQHFRKTGLQFCGLIMADHSKCGINTMFNTGTVVGVSANVFGAGYPRNYIPDFAWGGAHGFEIYALNKVFETAAKVFERRENRSFDENEQNILKEVFELTKPYRHF
ncbi:glucose-1-phosphate thymidylyltransferase [Mucilaginibacter sp. PPCGB 2223]|uniref:putative sugar nucleotidyl transferase n=1 Tax=Mucilaginibacter sp. PPCGB 2223 TaxID=1886027 RepID=UPI0008260A2D|nr:putative sugar nucleotidyl transferase [Mucilaginibacter sp. PPCGB 2223]OCX52871.1 glucose-1-phosphate thymidylyltransferase [Mucilaginibacter sp. PPCGB 2223]